MESSIIILIVGVVLGIVMTAKPIREVLGAIPDPAYNYVLLGVILFVASWLLQWMGFTVVVTTYLLYQLFGVLMAEKKAWQKQDFNVVRSWLKWAWPKRKKVPEPSDTSAPIVEGDSPEMDLDGTPQKENEPPRSIPLAGDSDTTDQSQESESSPQDDTTKQ
jgi:hypothetical protein